MLLVFLLVSCITEVRLNRLDMMQEKVQIYFQMVILITAQETKHDDTA